MSSTSKRRAIRYVQSIRRYDEAEGLSRGALTLHRVLSRRPIRFSPAIRVERKLKRGRRNPTRKRLHRLATKAYQRSKRLGGLATRRGYTALVKARRLSARADWARLGRRKLRLRSGRRNPRAFDKGAFVRVTMSKDDVSAFKSQWPSSGLRNRSITFAFSKRNGDLVDIMPSGVDLHADGEAIRALAEDAQRYARRRKKLVNPPRRNPTRKRLHRLAAKAWARRNPYVVKGYKYPTATPEDRYYKTLKAAERYAKQQSMVYGRPPIYSVSEREYQWKKHGRL